MSSCYMLYEMCRIYLAKIRNRALPCDSRLRIFLSLHWLACLCVCALVFQATAGGVGELEDFLSFSPLTGCVVFWAVCLGVYFSLSDKGGSQNSENLGLEKFRQRLQFVRQKRKLL